ncbi:calcitonin gene-related peptide type 1 receptor-like [Lineus longissimus]|uniref:calcitonin gene-related peptide type 1 receptor-like n=1 Tax=Lineus longissimus TaxID=88925 RepID=UPI002B4DC825
MIFAALIPVIFAQIASSGGESETYCLDSYGNLTHDDFITWTCSNCVPILFFKNDLPIQANFNVGPNLFLKANISVQYTPTVNDPPNVEVCEKYLTPDQCAQWYECCAAAKQCCEVQLQKPVQIAENTDFCPAVWDGVDCWSAAKASTLSRHECPSYYVDDDLVSSEPISTKICSAGGHWYSRPNSSGRAWTNYTNCFYKKDQTAILLSSIYVSFAFHLFSLASLVIAVALYAVFRSYLRRDEKGRCKFNLNINLFIAFIFMGLATIIYEPIYYLDAIVNLEDNRLDENTIECRVLKVLIWYFRSATYWWLFCEGLYLREVLINPIGGNKSMLKHIIIGWGLPFPPTIAWVVARVMTANERCWSGTASAHLDYIVVVPNLLALLLNLILLITVQVELMRHFADTNDDDVVDLVRQGIKVTFSLIPVFGVQILVLSYRPEDWLPYDIIANIVVGIQGFLVALMYCFLTKEIRNAYQRYKRHARISISKSSSKGTQSSRLSTSIAGSSSGRNASVPDSFPMQNTSGGTTQNEPRNSSVWYIQEAQSAGNQNTVIAL